MTVRIYTIHRRDCTVIEIRSATGRPTYLKSSSRTVVDWHYQEIHHRSTVTAIDEDTAERIIGPKRDLDRHRVVSLPGDFR